MTEFLLKIISGGLYALYDYLTAHVLTCLVPAFFIAGAMAALLPKEQITKYLGSRASKPKAYLFSVIAGLLLAVCSCAVLPLFAGIKKKGAGIGPAIAFLYTAPATNILAILFTGSVLGWNFALARIILSVSFAILIGLIISKLFPDKEEKVGGKTAFSKQEQSFKKEISSFIKRRLPIFFANLFSVLIVGAAKIGNEIKLPVIFGLLFTLLIQLRLRFSKEEIKTWFGETYRFFKVIFPLLLAGIFVAGMLGEMFPKNSLGRYLGGNTIKANLLAVLFGVFMYFPTLVEVPMAKMFLGLGMAKGPLLAYLLADPVISLSSILVVRKILGNKQTITYVILITIFTTISGLIYRFFVR